ncbi:hypothetical protein GCM10022222_03400 [Amycolatopsis ultiminotia]|uniref:Uncharacterized protein n=1 Tax=Amycolatopsis ultiminotia TaxID=543629 RepID=A0ABP6UWZ9_9PSEU
MALACAALASPMHAAPSTAAGTATNSDTPVAAVMEYSPHTIPIRRAYAVDVPEPWRGPVDPRTGGS